MTHTDSEPKTKDDVYRERNLLVLAFIRAYKERFADTIADPACGAYPDTDDVNGESWAVVWIETPEGQVGWHIPNKMVPGWLPTRDPHYDGYTTDQKNNRIERFIYK